MATNNSDNQQNAGTIIVYIYIIIQSICTIAVSVVSLLTIRNQKQTNRDKSTIKLGKQWFKTTWKMRSIYGTLFVHVFDVTTDLLVINEWYNIENRSEPIKHIDSRLMAWCSIGVLIFHRIFSAICLFFITNKNIWRTLAQLFDVLVFEEIYLAHRNIIAKINSNNQIS